MERFAGSEWAGQLTIDGTERGALRHAPSSAPRTPLPLILSWSQNVVLFFVYVCPIHSTRRRR
eukprot:scaffold222535_cov29-Tisochrysis_lutea.AAC.2